MKWIDFILGRNTENKPDFLAGTKGNKSVKVPFSQVNYKKYIALLSQSATNPPTAIELENSIGNIVWTYNVSGDYIGTLSGAFPSNKTFLLAGSIISVSHGSYVITNIGISRIDDNSIRVDVNADDVLNNSSIQILVST